ncbi:short-chain dehydrogenase [Sphingobium sp. AEW4]|nr:short-chain dehydrogenase [Sphingobium sp. AEW4]
MFNLAGKVALITGGCVGMGRAIGAVLSAAGAMVVLADDADRVAAFVPREEEGDTARVALDVTDEASIRRAIAEVASGHGGIDILVNAAVINHNRPTLDIDVAEWDHVQAVNLRGAFLTTKACVPLMQARGGGRIINVTTIGSRHPVLHGNGAYSASRAGLNQFTRNCALDFASDGITANAVLPGAIITETVDASAPRSGPGKDPKRQIGGYGKPADIAGLVLLLASPAGRYISGQLIAVDGGFLVS